MQRSATRWMLTSVLLLLLADSAAAATFTVNTTDDSILLFDGVCDAVHCSLREAVLTANTNTNAPTVDFITFNIPMSDSGFKTSAGVQCDQMVPFGVPDASPCWWTITLMIGDLPTITEPTTISGFSHPGDTNPLMLGSGETPGVVELVNPCVPLLFDRPEIAIDANTFMNPLSIHENASDVLIQGMAIYNAFLTFGGTVTPTGDGHAIVGLGGGTGVDRVINAMFVGLLPDGSDPGVLLRNKGFGVRQLSSGELDIVNSFVGHNGQGGIDGEASGTTIIVRQNEVFQNGWLSDAHDGIDINGFNGLAECNLAYQNTNATGMSKGDAGNGIELGSKSATAGVDNNLVRYNTSRWNLSAGISIRKRPRGNIFEKNVISQNKVGIVVDTEGGVPTNRNVFTQNSTFQNMTLGIDLTRRTLEFDPGLGDFVVVTWVGAPDGITANDSCDVDGGADPFGQDDGSAANMEANDLQNFPDLMSATLFPDGSLQIQGKLESAALRDYRIEFFRTPSGEAVLREGKFFIGSMLVTTGADCTTPFSTPFFAGTGAVAGDEITATATRVTDGDEPWSTSEYSEVAAVNEFVPEGKVTGGGYIEPTTPVCATPCTPNDNTRANFGFNASYHKDNPDPFGHINFVYRPGNIHFGSTDYEFASLDVTRDPDTGNGTAKWRGEGKLNNKPGYCFKANVTDLGEPGTMDRFRIKIWKESESPDMTCATDGPAIYDNGSDPQETANETVLSGGNIQIHRP